MSHQTPSDDGDCEPCAVPFDFEAAECQAGVSAYSWMETGAELLDGLQKPGSGLARTGVLIGAFAITSALHYGAERIADALLTIAERLGTEETTEAAAQDVGVHP